MMVILTVDIKFDDFQNNTIVLSQGTKVFYDATYNIALWKDYHFHIEPEEWVLEN